MNAPTDPLQERVEVPEPVTLVGVRVQVRPVEGDTTVAKVTTPLKLCRPVTVIVEIPEIPERTVTELGPSVREKSCTVSITVAE